jgi:hypothetical protein
MSLVLMAALQERSALNELDALRDKIQAFLPQQIRSIRGREVQARRVDD